MGWRGANERFGLTTGACCQTTDQRIRLAKWRATIGTSIWPSLLMTFCIDHARDLVQRRHSLIMTTSQKEKRSWAAGKWHLWPKKTRLRLAMVAIRTLIRLWRSWWRVWIRRRWRSISIITRNWRSPGQRVVNGWTWRQALEPCILKHRSTRFCLSLAGIPAMGCRTIDTLRSMSHRSRRALTRPLRPIYPWNSRTPTMIMTTWARLRLWSVRSYGSLTPKLLPWLSLHRTITTVATTTWCTQWALRYPGDTLARIEFFMNSTVMIWYMAIIQRHLNKFLAFSRQFTLLCNHGSSPGTWAPRLFLVAFSCIYI